MTEKSITPFLCKNEMSKCKNTPLKTSYLCFSKKVLKISFPELMLHTETKNKNGIWKKGNRKM